MVYYNIEQTESAEGGFLFRDFFGRSTYVTLSEELSHLQEPQVDYAKGIIMELFPITAIDNKSFRVYDVTDTLLGNEYSIVIYDDPQHGQLTIAFADFDDELPLYVTKRNPQ